MNQRQHDSSYRPVAMDSSPQLLSGTNYTTSTIVPRSNRTHYRQNRTSGIHGPGRLPAERRAPGGLASRRDRPPDRAAVTRPSPPVGGGRVPPCQF